MKDVSQIIGEKVKLIGVKSIKNIEDELARNGSIAYEFHVPEVIFFLNFS